MTKKIRTVGLIVGLITAAASFGLGSSAYACPGKKCCKDKKHCKLDKKKCSHKDCKGDCEMKKGEGKEEKAEKSEKSET